MIFFSLITTAISCIFYGIIVTIVIMVLLYVVLQSVDKGIVKTPVFYVTGVFLALLLTIQVTLMIGAIKAKNTADSAQQYLTELIHNYQGMSDAIESRQAVDALADEFPIIGNFIDLTAFYGRNISELPTAIYATMADYLNSYIWHRVWWVLGTLILASFVVIMFGKKGGCKRGKISNYGVRSYKNYDNF